MRMIRYGLDKLLDRGCHFAGTRVGILCRIVTDVGDQPLPHASSKPTTSEIRDILSG
jgi:hypothetical protein